MAQSTGTAGGAVLREWKGVYGDMGTAADKVVRTPAEWNALWRQVHSNQVPPPAAPRVDFAAEMVLAVFMGEQTSGGYSVHIQKVTVGPKQLTVTVREQRPPADAITTQALTYPFHMVVVRKSALPVKFVRAAGPAAIR